MRGKRERQQLAQVVICPALVDGAVVEDLDAAVERGVGEVVLDVSATERVDDEALLLVDWLAQRLENAGGSLIVTARRPPRGTRSTKTLRAGDLTLVLGVQPALDRAILRRLTARAGGAALW